MAILAVLFSSGLSAHGGSLTLTAPTTVSADADGNTAAPWNADGVTTLRLTFQTDGIVPAGATITAVTVRVQGAALGASYRSEIDLTLRAPGGSSVRWDFGDDLGLPESAGNYDTGVLAATGLGGSASGAFVLEFAEDYDDAGSDNRVNSVALQIDYAGGDAVGAYLNGVFPTADPANGGAQPPALLSQTGAFADLANLTPAAGLLPYAPNSPLWSDAAIKTRWVAVPSDGTRDSAVEKVVFSPEAAWTFPAGTVAVKHFELATDETDPTQRRRLETRFIVVTPGGGFYGVTYRWRADGLEADLLPDADSADITIAEAGGSSRVQRWDFPSRADCRTCHNPGSGTFLGLQTYQMNGDFPYPGESQPRNQLEAWEAAGLFTAPLAPVAGYPRAVAVSDQTASLEQRVHSYLAANCSNCHYPGNLNSGFDLRFSTPVANQNVINGSVLYDLGIAGGRVVVPQDPASSLLHYRMNTTGIHKMPPIGRNVIDQTAIDTVRDWILSLDPGTGSGGANNPPIANNDEGLTQTGVATNIAAFGNDIDPDGDAFSLDQSTPPAHGTASWSPTGVVTYTPAGGFAGTDSFTYRIVDSNGAVSNTTTVTVTVSPATPANAVAFSNSSALLADPSDASGVAMGVVDMDQDGRDDIVHLDLARAIHIDYQQATGVKFTRLSLGTPSSQPAWGLAIGDADNNGMPDLVTGGYYDGLHYFRANGSGSAYTRTDLNAPAVFLQAVSFADINGDGWLDIFACHDDGHSAKFRNLGNGTFVDGTSMMDTRTQPASDNSGNYGLVWTDYDNDSDLDAYVAKCRIGASSPTDPRRINQLFRNDGNGSYSEVAAAAGLADGAQSWVSDFADVDNDGDLDCFIGNHGAASRLMRNNGNGTFTDVTAARGISVNWNVIQSVFRDFNGDGWIDLLLTGSQHQLWLNDRDGTFTQAPNPFTSTSIESCAVGDLNRDGFPDVYAGYASLYNTPVATRPDRLFLSAPNGNGFLSVELRGRQSNRLASGARLELHGAWGVQLREVRSGEGYGVTHSFSQRFGLGNAASADQLVVRWPSGTVDTAANVAANQFLLLEEGDTQPPSLANPGNQTSPTTTAVQLSLSASDPTDNALTFAATNLPAGLSIDPLTGTISGTTGNAAGTFPVTVTVTDGWSTVSRSFTWSITASDTQPPTVALSTASNTVSAPFTVSVAFSETVSGFDLGDIVVTNGLASGLSGAQFTVTPAADGTVTVRIPAGRVTDPADNGNAASNLLSVTYAAPTGGGGGGGDGEITPDANTVALYRFEGNFNDAWANALHLSAAGTVGLVDGAARFDAVGDRLTAALPDSLVLPADGRPLVIDARIRPRNWLAYSVDNLPVISLYQEWNAYLALEDQKWGASPKGPNVQSSNGIVATAAQWAGAITPNAWNRIWTSTAPRSRKPRCRRTSAARTAGR